HGRGARADPGAAAAARGPAGVPWPRPPDDHRPGAGLEPLCGLQHRPLDPWKVKRTFLARRWPGFTTYAGCRKMASRIPRIACPDPRATREPEGGGWEPSARIRAFRSQLRARTRSTESPPDFPAR